MYIVYGVYRDVATPLFYTLEEGNAARLVDRLNNHRHDYDMLNYMPLVDYKRTHRGWSNPFTIRYIMPEGDHFHMSNLIKPDWMTFTLNMAEEAHTYENSRQDQGRILSDTGVNDGPDSADVSNAERDEFMSDFRSRMRRRSRIGKRGKGKRT